MIIIAALSEVDIKGYAFVTLSHYQSSALCLTRFWNYFVSWILYLRPAFSDLDWSQSMGRLWPWYKPNSHPGNSGDGFEESILSFTSSYTCYQVLVVSSSLVWLVGFWLGNWVLLLNPYNLIFMFCHNWLVFLT